MRPLGLDERMAVLAAAISIDFDYFSQHSQHGAGGMMPFFLPIPMPSPPYPPPDNAAGAGAEGAEGVAAGDSAGAQSAACGRQSTCCAVVTCVRARRLKDSISVYGMGARGTDMLVK